MGKRLTTFYTVYKTTNLLNGKIYVGTHKTSNPDDDYLGSGKLLNYAIEKYGKENFKKEVLAIFDNPEQMFEMESQIVNEEFVNSKETYNLNTGGHGGYAYMVKARGKRGIYTNGVDSKCKERNSPDVISGEWVSVNKNKIICMNTEGLYKSLDKNSKEWESGEYVGVMKGRVVVKDSQGNVFSVSCDDPRYKNGSLKHINSGRKHINKENFKGTRGMRAVFNGEKRQFIKVGEEIPEGYKPGGIKWKEAGKVKIRGEKNANYGAKWMYKDSTKECKFIKKSEIETYQNRGWSIGFRPLYCGRQIGVKRDYKNCKTTKGRVWCHKGGKRRLVEPEKLENFLLDGWIKGYRLREGNL